MEGMGLIFTPVIGRRLLCHLSMFRPMAGNSETHILLKEVVLSGTDPEKIKGVAGLDFKIGSYYSSRIKVGEVMKCWPSLHSVRNTLNKLFQGVWENFKICPPETGSGSILDSQI